MEGATATTAILLVNQRHGLANAEATAADADGEYLILPKVADGVCWEVVSHGERLSKYDAATLRHAAKSPGLPFVAHPLLTPFPWRQGVNANAIHALPALDADRKARL